MACEGQDCAGPLAYQAYGSTDNPKALVVFLHGSVSAGGPADYMYNYARKFSLTYPKVLSIALLAPGYYDRQGKRSDGSDAGRRLSDDTDAVIAALKILKSKYKTDSVFVLGHSKGAMNMGGVLGKEPGLVNGAVLVAGIYDLQALASYRNRAQNGIQGIDLVSRIPPPTRIVLVHGDRDTEVPLSQSVAFNQRAQEAKISSKLVVLEGAAHNFSGPVSQAAIEQLGELVAD
jgi:dipeptidyl aminopeptidase/acylaminoacyl peptidase